LEPSKQERPVHGDGLTASSSMSMPALLSTVWSTAVTRRHACLLSQHHNAFASAGSIIQVHAAHARQVAMTLFPFIASEASYLEATARNGAKRHLNCRRCLLLPACQFDLALDVILDPAWHCGQETLTAATALQACSDACILVNAGLYDCDQCARRQKRDQAMCHLILGSSKPAPLNSECSLAENLRCACLQVSMNIEAAQ
jgi:hypothetical protein